MAERTYGLSDLGEAEDRLRSLLDVEGKLPVEPTFKILPVWILGDATEPGMARTKGRRWAMTEVSLVANFQVMLSAQQDVILDRIEWSTAGGAGGGAVHVRVEPSPSLVVGASGLLFFLDRLTGTERPPMLRGMGGGGPFGNIVSQTEMPVGDGWIGSYSYPFCLRRDQSVNVRWATFAGGVLNVSFFGRVFG